MLSAQDLPQPFDRKLAHALPLRPGTDHLKAAPALAAFGFLTACVGPQSALDPAGRDAETLADLFFWLVAGAVVLWVLMNGLMFYAWRAKPRPISPKTGRWLIFGGGIVFPTVVLAGLLSYGLSVIPDQRAPGEGLRVEITGEQWWFRVAYWPEGATEPIHSANEVVFPVGQRSELTLKADQVIHSFWLPSLAGKTDMIPGRVNRMSLEPTEPGEFRGQCAEYCGESHAWMAFTALTLMPEEFDAFLQDLAAPAVPPDTEVGQAGRTAFMAHGCGGCHTIRGTPARGNVGPDLTHVGSRLNLAAGALDVTVPDLAAWITDPKAIKAGAKMPAYDHLDPDEIVAMAVYLEGLK
ncbi:cytochrome c oxidase subunit II [Palleronia abyssalis]|uniref:Cytochrome c oxidase subunit 2 n=1 Tax=Palleronia abyssalis TaxID=1501240 RepID=A0A2R8BTE5_9RHOB|nr:cytochrome c oxidase subunit II [Palleronia abyssalis]SPJ23449.1 Cytochrome c oxidase subunit 2 [Palleronia abyssalis]